MKLMRGALIVVEGVDRTGKSTQCKALVESLNATQIPAEYANFPARNTEVGKAINNYLTSKSELPDEAIHLLFSANRWEKAKHIIKTLDMGISIVIDRYCYSGVAFSAAKGLDMKWCKSSDAGLPRPDKVFFLTMPVESIQQRNGYGNERFLQWQVGGGPTHFGAAGKKPFLKSPRASRRSSARDQVGLPSGGAGSSDHWYEVLDFQKKVFESYKQLIEDNWEQLDASRSIETIQEELLRKSLEVIKNVKMPINKMWMDL